MFVVRYKHVAIYCCAQTVFEKTLYMGMSLVKALILKVFRARRKDTTTNVMCIVFEQTNLPRQEAVAKEVRALNSVPII